MKNTLIKVLSFVMALTMLTSVFVTGSFAVDETAGTPTPSTSTEEKTECADGEHQWKLEAVVEEPTCEGKPGDASSAVSIYRVCEICEKTELYRTYDETLEGVACNKNGHPLAAYEYTITLAPTCTEPGKADFKCPTCGDGFEDIPVAALGHAWGEWTEVTAATCTDDGSQTRTCTRCGVTENEDIDALGHNYVPVTQGCDCVITNKEALFNGTYKGANGKSIFALSKEGNCFELGYTLMHCTKCDDLIIDWDEEPEHVWEEVQVGVDDQGKPIYTEIQTEVFPDAVGTPVCIQWTREYKVCENCGYEKEIRIVEPVGHQWEAKDPTDTTDGWEYVQGTYKCDNTSNYYIRECVVCQTAERGYFATEPHTMNKYGCPTCDAAGTACTDCKHADRYVVCSVCGGNKTDVATKEDHAWDNGRETTPGTCVTPSKITYTCTNDGCTQYKVEDGQVDADAHGNNWVVEYKQTANCVVPELETGYCKACHYTGTIKIKDALGHDMKPNANNIVPTCQSAGYDYGTVCSRCGITEAGKGALQPDPTNHPDPDKFTTVGERKATCVVPSATIVKYTTCGCIAVKADENNVLDPENHVVYTYAADNQTVASTTSLLTPVAAVQNYCQTAGSKGYTYCAGCKLVTAIDGMSAEDVKKANKTYNDAFVAEMVIPAIGHTMTVLVSRKINETCVAPGKEAVMGCANLAAAGVQCDHTEGGEAIDAHGKSYAVTYTAKDPTCTESGLIGGTFCSKCAVTSDCTHCDNYEQQVIRDYVKTSATDPIKSQVIAALGHDVQDHAGYVVNQSCDTTGYTPKKCTRCYDMSVWSITNYKAATGEHKYPDAWDTTYEDPTCTEDGYQFKACTTCTDGDPEVIYNEEYAASEDAQAKGHLHNGAVIELGCKKYDKYTGTACSVCGLVAGTDIEHNYVANITPNTCTEAGEISWICTDCGEKKPNTAIILAARGHVYKETVEYILPTTTQDGHWTWECAICGEEQVEVLPASQDVIFDIDVTPYIEGVDAEELTIVNGGLIEVTISVTADQLAFNSFKHTLAYNSEKLSFVSAEFVGEFEGAESFVKDNGDNVVASFWAMNGNVTLDGEDVAFVTYIFQVAPGVDALVNGYITNADVWFDADAAEGITTVLNQIDGDIDVALMGDVDGNGAYEVSDVLALRQIVTAGEYNNVADFDNDGDVDTADFIALATFVTSNQTVADYYAMFDVSVVDLVAAYDYNDYNADNAINEIDAKLFAAAAGVETSKNWALALTYGDFTAVLDAVDADLSK